LVEPRQVNCDKEIPMARILVADDDPSIRDIIARKLTAAGHEVVAEADGAAVLATAKTMAPDIIILDWMMPELTGVEVCRAVRSLPELARVHIIVTSAMSQRDRVRQALGAGADDFLAKPFNPNELRKLIADALTTPVPANGDLSYNEALAAARGNGE
jgi:CheY-like chemotaxis protein